MKEHVKTWIEEQRENFKRGEMELATGIVGILVALLLVGALGDTIVIPALIVFGALIGRGWHNIRIARAIEDLHSVVDKHDQPDGGKES